MQMNRSSLLSLYRVVVQPALIVSLITLLAGLSPAAVVAESEASTSRELRLTYRWNLHDDSLPLISLPDRIGEGVDLSLTYSMDQYQFPLFQSLYHNQQLAKYILLVIPKQSLRRVEFINMSSKGKGQFVADNSNLRLTDKGFAKQISTGDGTVYTFTPVGDGEFHCSRIESQGGVRINLKYTNKGSIETIADAAGRTINFGYTEEFLSSITQSWGVGPVRVRQTWAIAVDAAVLTRAKLADTRVVSAKIVPTNAIKPIYTAMMSASDLTLARMFGGPGAVAAANGFEPMGLGSQYPFYRGDLIGDDGIIRRGHLSYAMHLYGSPNGRGDTAIYVPAGYVSHSSQPTPTDAAVTFYYPRLGNITNVTLAVFHVANFQLSEENGRVRIGSIGGPGGSVASYKHAHLEFYRGDTGLPPASHRARLRINPSAVFDPNPTPHPLYD
ncbi:MAG TPA: hypothetical protein VJU84_20120 [Pyrinomonadaceae bacterium]|nr:hypothetical protein [Pyrinomonadaceae bacterium]